MKCKSVKAKYLISLLVITTNLLCIPSNSFADVQPLRTLWALPENAANGNWDPAYITYVNQDLVLGEFLCSSASGVVLPGWYFLEFKWTRYGGFGKIYSKAIRCENESGSVQDPVSVSQQLSCPPDFLEVLNFTAGPISCQPTKFYLHLPDEQINEAKSCPTENVPSAPEYIFNPISVATGNKRLVQSEITGGEPLSLSFTRYYNSFGTGGARLGNHWTHTYSAKIELTTEPVIGYPPPQTLLRSSYYNTPGDACTAGWAQLKPGTELAAKPTTVMLTADGSCNISSEGTTWRTLTIYKNDGIAYRTLGSQVQDVLKVHRADGRIVVFKKRNGAWVNSSTITERVEEVLDASGLLTGYNYYADNNRVESYDAQGQLLSITRQNGLVETLTYDSASGVLQSVTTNVGRSLTFTSDAQHRISTLSDDAGRTWRFQYDAGNNLEYVVYPDGTAGDDSDNPRRRYHYENAAFPGALTGITDERGNFGQ